MKVVCTTVIRSVSPEETHGGIYIVDMDDGRILEYRPYQGDIRNDNERGGERGLRGIQVLDDSIIVADSSGLSRFSKDLQLIEKVTNRDVFHSIHEICLFDGDLWVTSTRYDSIVRVGLDLSIKDFYSIQGHPISDGKVLTGKTSIEHGTADDSDEYHINSISANNGRLVISGLTTGLYDLSNFEMVADMPWVPVDHNGQRMRTRSFLHNYYEYEDINVVNLTHFSSVMIFDKKENSAGFAQLPPVQNIKHDDNDNIAKAGWNRGMARNGNFLLVGSSPASIYVLDLGSKTFHKQVSLEMDTRHAIHGLEILEK